MLLYFMGPFDEVKPLNSHGKSRATLGRSFPPSLFAQKDWQDRLVDEVSGLTHLYVVDIEKSSTM